MGDGIVPADELAVCDVLVLVRFEILLGSGYTWIRCRGCRSHAVSSRGPPVSEDWRILDSFWDTSENDRCKQMLGSVA